MVNNFIFVIMSVLSVKVGLFVEFIVKKLLCLVVFQGQKIGIIKKIQKKYVFFVIGVYQIVYWYNLIYKILFFLDIMVVIEDFF